MLYLSIILFGIISIQLCNYFFYLPLASMSFFALLGYIIMGAVLVFAVDGVFAFIIRRLPNKWFKHDRKISIVSKKEVRFYEKLKIKKWKDKVLELGFFTNFSKKNIRATTPEFFERFIMENNYGVFVHLSNIFVGFLIIPIMPAKLALTVSLPICLFNIFLHILPMFILRYNNPKMLVTLKFLKRKEQKANKTTQNQNAEKIEIVEDEKNNSDKNLSNENCFTNNASLEDENMEQLSKQEN